VNNSNYNVSFIIPYSGTQAPVYLPLFLNSCKHNLKYRFLFFTDLKINNPLPSNVEIIPFTKEYLEELILRNTGIKANLDRFYKICDFKPVFGEIFKDYIQTPFWGHTDIDLVYGDLDKFLTPILDDYDIFSFRREYHTGSFAIYRNTPEVNGLYRKINNYKETLSHPLHFAFDEVSRFKSRSGHIYKYLLSGNCLADEETEVESFTHLLMDTQRTKGIRMFNKTLIKEGIDPGEVLKISNGKIISTKKPWESIEYLLYHFVLEKAVPTFDYPSWKIIPDEYFITRFGFHKRKGLISLQSVLRYIDLYFTSYPVKVIERAKRIFSRRFSLNEKSA
jgi:hypothetical protein